MKKEKRSGGLILQKQPIPEPLVRLRGAAYGGTGLKCTEKEKEGKCLGRMRWWIWGCMGFENGDKCVMVFFGCKSERAGRRYLHLSKEWERITTLSKFL